MLYRCHSILICLFLSFLPQALYAAAGSIGSNGLVPYLTVDGKYTGENITVQLHDASSNHGLIYYFFSNDEEVIKLHTLGFGGIFLPKLDPEVKPVDTYSEHLSIPVPTGIEGETFYIQALITETNPTQYGTYHTLSRPLKVMLAEKQNTANLTPTLASPVPHAGSLSKLIVKDNFMYGQSFDYHIVKFARNPHGVPEIRGVLTNYNPDLPVPHPSWLALSLNRAVVGASDAMLIADISDANKPPQLIGQGLIPEIDGGRDAIGFENGPEALVFVVAEDRLAVVNVTSNVPFLKSHINTGHSLRQIREYNGYIYVSTLENKLLVYRAWDLANLQQPSLVQVQSGLPNYPIDIAIDNNHLFTLAKQGSTREIQIYKILSSGQLSYRKTINLGEAGSFTGIKVASNTLYCLAEYHFNTYSINWSSLTLTQVATVDMGARDVVVESGALHVARGGYGEHGLYSFALPNMEAFPSPAYNDQHENVGDLAVVGTHLAGQKKIFAFVQEDSKGLQVVDFSEATAPRLVNNISGNYRTVTADNGRLAYVRHTNEVGLAIVSSLNGDLTTVAEFAPANRVRDVKFFGDSTLLVGAHSDGLMIFDISKPQQPQLISSINQDGFRVYNIEIVGYLAYVAGGGNPGGMQVIDLSDVKNPEIVQAIPGLGMKWSKMATDGQVLALPYINDGISFYFTGAPFAPAGISYLKSFHTISYAIDAAILNNIAVVTQVIEESGSEDQIYFFDISDVNNVRLLAREKFPQLNFNPAVTIFEGKIYVSDQKSLAGVIELN